MTPTADSPAPISLPDGLVLRPSRPADLDQICELLAVRGEPADAADLRLVVTGPDADWSACAVVVDGDRVVSTATLLDEEVRIGEVRLPAGQVELVATDRAYEGRGLVRQLMRWAHERSAARGHVMQVMIGIPYFYRLFGYEYAIDIAPAPTVRVVPDGTATPTLRRATPADIPAIAALQDAAQHHVDVAVPHSPARRHWLVSKAHEATTTWVLDDPGTGEVIATGRTLPPDDDGGLLLAEPAARDAASAMALLRGAAALLPTPDARLRAVHRPGTVTATAWHDLIDLEPRTEAQQYYVRIPDVAVLLDRLRPLLQQRLSAAEFDRSGRDIVLSTFRAHYRIPVDASGTLGEVAAGGPMQGPGAAKGAGIAPDHLPALLFGPHGIDGLSRIRADVYATDRELFRTLFPPLSADVLSFYLPY